MRCVMMMLLALVFIPGYSQLIIEPGGIFHINNSEIVCLQNANLVNNGTLSVAGNGRMVFNGSDNNAVEGTVKPVFAELEIAKTGSGTLTLQQTIGVKNKIVFTSNLIELNTNNIELGNTAFLENENENSRITGISGGEVLFTTALNAPSAANPANLGAIITSTQDLGLTVIRRGHQSQTNGSSGGNSIFRYFDITPANNVGLNATLRMQYFDAELNGLAENTLSMWKSNNNSNWQNPGYSNRDAAANILEKTGIADFSRFTLSSIGNALPLKWGPFNIRCEDGKVIIYWQTLNEFNTRSFIIQRSNNGGSQWTNAGVVMAAGNSNMPLNYSFSDTQTGGLYRILQTDLDGRISFSPVLQNPCESQEIFRAYPNPVQDILTIEVYVEKETPVVVNIIDSRGSIVKQRKEQLHRGINRLQLNLSGLTAGDYWLYADWPDRKHRIIQLEKL